MIDFQRATLEDCQDARGIVVVIDVLRAFTTAAFAFEAGAGRLVLVSTLEEARALKQRSPGWILSGEDGGRKPPDFDFGNSPQEFIGQALDGATVIQRTTAGTQGVVHSTQADELFAASLCCAGPTVAAIRELVPRRVTFVLTGFGRDGFGDEDAACADYIEAQLCGQPVDERRLMERVRLSGWGRRFGDPDYDYLDPRDLEHCQSLNRFPLALHVRQEGGQFVMQAVDPSAGIKPVQ